MSIEEFPRAGVFTIGTGLPGAPRDLAHLSIMADTVTGMAAISQPVSPPLHFATEMRGDVHVLVSGAHVQQIYALQGSPSIVLAGYWIRSMVISLDGIWGTKGTASYTYVTPDKEQVKVENQPVNVKWWPLAE